MNELIQRADDRMVTLMETGLGGKRRVVRRDAESTDANLSGVPVFLRDLLVRLPMHTGPPPDIDTFVDHLRRTVLPPRPVTEDREEGTSLLQTKPSTEDDIILLSGTKRVRNYGEDEEDDEDNGRGDDDNRDDIFRARCRARISADS